MRTSSRLPRDQQPNTLTRALASLRARGEPVLDLTASNPTRAGLPYPGDLLTTLTSTQGLQYDPAPAGLLAARDAIAADSGRRGARVRAEDVVLTASTSEAYTWLFKLLCDPGDAVLVPRPSYPLFEHLTALEGVRAAPYDLHYHGRWDLDVASIVAPDRVRAVIVVSPNNPTGSFMSVEEFQALEQFCLAHRCAVIVDEVFADFPIDVTAPVTDWATRADVLTFTLGGLSKTLGLPQLKLGWILVGGRPAERRAAIEALEFVGDCFLSVGTPVQLAAPALFERAAPVRGAILQRLRANLAALRAEAAAHPEVNALRVEGGWSAVIRVPATRPEEAFVLELLTRERVLVHPGYYFEFPSEAFIVVSLLVEERTFADGCARLMRSVAK